MPLPLGLTWDPTFLHTRAGLTLAGEAVVGLVGALVGFLFANGLESFLCWGAFFISGLFLGTHVTNLTQSLESRIPAMAKIHLTYIAVWSFLLSILCIYRFVAWSLQALFDWVLLLLFLVDLFFKYRSWKSSTVPGSPSNPGPTPETVETGGKF